jgi:outer membrane receptor for ferrienterochelin and colicin
MRSASLFFLLLFNWIETFSQNYIINGYIEDSKSGERLIGAMICDSVSHSGSNSNFYGYYTIKCSSGPVNLVASYLGYETLRINFTLVHDTVLNIFLQPQTYNLAEVIIDDKKRLIESSRMSTSVLSVSSIKQIPMLMGETDVLKVMQFLPGVQTGTEGTSGLYIRGGGPDQNLILLDGVPVYNPDHLFGFVSIFNADAIKNVTLITGGFPAQYGGRLSSVVDIRMKEGNNKEIHGEGTIGLVSSKIMIEGPLKNDKTSFLLSGRRSWIDMITRTIPKSKQLPYYYFYDLTAKVNHVFSDKSRLYLSVYTGEDHISSINTKNEFVSGGIRYTSGQNQYYGWGNITAALRWNYIFNNRLFGNTNVTYSNYKYFDYKLLNNTQINLLTGVLTRYDYRSDFNSGIKDVATKADFDYQPFTGHNMKFGMGGIYHMFTPYANISLINTDNGSALPETDKNKQLAFEPSIYIEDEIQLSSRLKVNTGFRISAFLVKNRTYSSFEPRLSGRYLLTDRCALKFAYSRMKQYIHLLTSSRITFPTDLWVPATDKVSPQISDQFALGSIHNFNDEIELSIETYYKSMKDLIEYSEGSSFLEGGNWESKIEKGGIGRAYGLEFMLKKSSGKTTGWISYTLSKTERKFSNISSGNWFPYKYDRRHDITLMLNRRFNDRIDAGLTWEFSSGNLFTLITDVYDSYIVVGPKIDILYYENRNNYRLPAYHRLDLGINFHKQKRSFYRTWSVSIYNAYNHMNVFFVYFGNDDLHGRKDLLVFKKYTLFPIIPSVTYSLRF